MKTERHKCSACLYYDVCQTIRQKGVCDDYYDWNEQENDSFGERQYMQIAGQFISDWWGYISQYDDIDQ